MTEKLKIEKMLKKNLTENWEQKIKNRLTKNKRNNEIMKLKSIHHEKIMKLVNEK